MITKLPQTLPSKNFFFDQVNRNLTRNFAAAAAAALSETGT